MKVKMMEELLLLLLLCACFCGGLSYDRLEYGGMFTMRLNSKAKVLTFKPLRDSRVTTLWRRDGSAAGEDSRRSVLGSLFMIYSVTHQDSGTYTARDKDQQSLSVRTITVVARERSFRKDEGESFRFDYGLEPNSCNIHFFPRWHAAEHQIVRHGKLRSNPDCSGFALSGQCGVSNSSPLKSCSGRYELRDSEGGKVLVVTVEVQGSSSFDTKEIGKAVGFFFAMAGCCVFVKCCCCRTSDSKQEAEAPDEAPAVRHHQYAREPAGPEQLYPAQPAFAPGVPLIHNPPSTVPPAYSEIFSAPSVPVQSDGQPRFELKGTTVPSAPPLSSDSPYGDVYTSEKLNFF